MTVVELLRRCSRHQNVAVRLQRVHGRAVQGAPRQSRQSVPAPSQPWAVPRRLGSSSVAALVQAYEAGATAAELAELYGLSRTAIKDLLHTQGVAVRRPRGIAAEDVPEAARLYEGGWLLREIGDKYGVSQENVRRRLREHGVVMRERRGRSRKP